MLVDLVAAGGAAGAILNHGSGGAPLTSWSCDGQMEGAATVRLLAEVEH